MLSSRPAAVEADAFLFRKKRRISSGSQPLKYNSQARLPGFGQGSGLMLQPGKHVFQILDLGIGEKIAVNPAIRDPTVAHAQPQVHTAPGKRRRFSSVKAGEAP